MLRRTTKDDIDAIVNLYSSTKSTTELQWVLSDPLDHNSLRSLVAVSNNKIAGHISYIISRFRYMGLEFSGVFPYAWIVSPEYKGSGIGSKLMTKVCEMADFTYFFGGSAQTLKVVPFMGFELKFYVREYVKSVDPLRTAQSSEAIVALEECDKPGYVQNRFDDPVFFNTAETHHINWLLDCPLCDTYAFSIKQNNIPTGIAICYSAKSKDAILTGRIVHLSYLGDDPDTWRTTIHEVEQSLIDKGCSTITTLASHPVYISALEGCGYSPRESYPVPSFTRAGRPFFLKDPKGILSDISDESFHWTFFEGDMGYRNL